jgi:glycosyltransferase involved in cell wall biosynthesis
LVVSDRPIRVLFVTPYYDEQTRDPVEALDRFPILTELPQEMRARGHLVQVLGLAPQNASYERNGIKFKWVSASVPVRLAGRLLNRWKPHYGPAYYQPSLQLARTIRSIDPDIVHVFGLTMDLQLALIRLLASSHSHIVVHYHGGIPVQGALRHRIQSFALSRVEAACFTSASQATPWATAGLIPFQNAHEILETSSPFSGIDQEQAREITGMVGDPVYLSAGRLHPIKDPLTMLTGFAHIARQQPDARLYLYYLTDEMLQDGRALVHSFPYLRERVEFRGRARPDEMEAIYSSADILLQASLRDWSGLAILEAMSCGCIPVVSDIPSFQSMAGNERYGRLFEPGNAGALANAALSIEDLNGMSAEVKRHFKDELSFAAIARDLETLYRSMLATA